MGCVYDESILPTVYNYPRGRGLMLHQSAPAPVMPLVPV